MLVIVAYVQKVTLKCFFSWVIFFFFLLHIQIIFNSSLLFFIFFVNSDLKCFNNITACMCLEMNQKTSVISFKGLTVCNFFSCFCVTVCYNVIQYHYLRVMFSVESIVRTYFDPTLGSDVDNKVLLGAVGCHIFRYAASTEVNLYLENMEIDKQLLLCCHFLFEQSLVLCFPSQKQSYINFKIEN